MSNDCGMVWTDCGNCCGMACNGGGHGVECALHACRNGCGMLVECLLYGVIWLRNGVAWLLNGCGMVWNACGHDEEWLLNGC